MAGVPQLEVRLVWPVITMCHHSPGNQVWQRGGQADAAGQAGVARAPGSGDIPPGGGGRAQ